MNYFAKSILVLVATVLVGCASAPPVKQDLSRPNPESAKQQCKVKFIANTHRRVKTCK